MKIENFINQQNFFLENTRSQDLSNFELAFGTAYTQLFAFVIPPHFSIIRALGLKEKCYDRLLDCFHSSAIRLDALSALWTKLIITWCSPFLLKVNDRLVVLGNGIKVSKSGKKMPAVKKLHQESQSNTKPEYIFGHSCQAIAIVAGCLETFFAILYGGIISRTCFNNVNLCLAGFMGR